MLTELERRQGEKERSGGREGGRQMEGRVRGCQGNQTLPEQSSQLEGLSKTLLRKSYCFEWNKNGTKMERVDEKNTTGVNIKMFIYFWS